MAKLRGNNPGRARHGSTRDSSTPGTPGHGDLTVTGGKGSKGSKKPKKGETVDPYNTLGSDEARERRRAFSRNEKN